MVMRGSMSSDDDGLIYGTCLLLSCCFTSTETKKLIRDGRMEVEGGGGDYKHIAKLSPSE